MTDDERNEDIDGDMDDTGEQDEDLDFNGTLELDLEDGDGSEEDDEGASDKDKEKQDEEKDAEQAKTSQQIESLAKQVADLEKMQENNQAFITTLKKENAEFRKNQKKDPEGEASFSDAQLKQIMEEHRDDPGVQIQVLKQLVNQELKGMKQDTLNEAEIGQTKKEIEDQLYQTYPDLKNDGSDMRKSVDEAKGKLHLNDHPFSDFLGVGALLLTQFPQLIEDAKKQGAEEALKGKTEDNRKERIKNTGLANRGNKKGSQVDLSAQHNETAKQLGMNKQQKHIYKQMLKGSEKQPAMTVEV
jgi:hypothetical protein